MFQVADLKKALKERGLSVSGSKHELSERLTASIASQEGMLIVIHQNKLYWLLMWHCQIVIVIYVYLPYEVFNFYHLSDIWLKRNSILSLPQYISGKE